MAVPNGRRVVIKLGGTDIMRNPRNNIAPGLELVLENDFSLNLSSNFKPLYSGGGNDLATFAGSISRDLGFAGFSGQFKEFGAQIWQNTEPINFTLDFKFYKGITEANDARLEVYNPMKALQKLPLPIEGSSASEFDLPVSITNLIPPGPSFLNVLGLSDTSALNISIQVGNIINIPKVIVKRAQPTYSNEVDENGYPLWGMINLEVSSLYTATTSMIDLNSEGGST